LEQNRGYSIPDWAYRDVLFMLIYYSIGAYELLERPLNDKEKEEVYNVFYRVGDGMGLKELPNTYKDWLPIRASHLRDDLHKSDNTIDLFKQYKKHLGTMRYKVLIEAQKLVVPETVRSLMQFGDFSWLKPTVPLYKFSRRIKLDGLIKFLLLPSEYKAQIKELDIVSS
jgi:hypothetical protein